MSGDKITFKCRACGSAKFALPSNPRPDDVVTCSGCGATARYGDVQAATVKLAKREIQDMFERAFAGKKGWTFTRR
jgi:RNase P subunit RPR2